MKQTFNVGYLQTPSVKNLENAKQALFESGLVESTTPDEMLPDAIEEGVKKLKGQSSAPVDNGAIYEGKYRVRYFDIDGTVLKIEYVANGGKTTPPDAPTYDPNYLIFDEWNYDTANYIVEQPTDIGATYKTVDDITYMWCRFTTNTGLNPTLAISGFTSIDWGDGTVDTNNSHTYANDGDYLIKISGDFSFTTLNSTSSPKLLGSSNLNMTLRKCYIKQGITSISATAFNGCQSLTTISIPNSITSIGQTAFANCYSLISISIPNSITNIEQQTFSSAYGLTTISIPNSITSIGQTAFANCFGLTSISIPNSITNMPSSMFTYCYGLTRISIPNSITNIAGNVFYMCYGLTNCFINCNTIPTLSSKTTFNGVNSSLIIWVKDDIIDQLKVATNWSSWSSYMKPLSWYPSLTDPNA